MEGERKMCMSVCRGNVDIRIRGKVWIVRQAPVSGSRNYQQTAVTKEFISGFRNCENMCTE